MSSDAGLEGVALVGAGLDLAQRLVPLPAEGLVAGAQAGEAELERGVLEGLVGESDDDLLHLPPQQDRLARPRAEEVLLVLAPQLAELVVEDPELFVDGLGGHS